MHYAMKVSIKQTKIRVLLLMSAIIIESIKRVVNAYTNLWRYVGSFGC